MTIYTLVDIVYDINIVERVTDTYSSLYQFDLHCQQVSYVKGQTCYRKTHNFMIHCTIVIYRHALCLLQYVLEFKPMNTEKSTLFSEN